VNFSADDDSRVLEELILPHYNFLALINQTLHIYGQGENFDDTVVQNVLWVLGNLIAEKNPEMF
jgi:hypothetical protein